MRGALDTDIFMGITDKQEVVVWGNGRGTLKIEKLKNRKCSKVVFTILDCNRQQLFFYFDLFPLINYGSL